jgi:hypothetical protein
VKEGAPDFEGRDAPTSTVTSCHRCCTARHRRGTKVLFRLESVCERVGREFLVETRAQRDEGGRAGGCGVRERESLHRLPKRHGLAGDDYCECPPRA